MGYYTTVTQVPPFCAGTGAPIPKSAVDGNFVATCPTCRRHVLAEPIWEDPEGRYSVEAHGPVLPRRTPGATLHLFEGGPHGPTYACAVCGTLALPTNSNLVDNGRRFVHRACTEVRT